MHTDSEGRSAELPLLTRHAVRRSAGEPLPGRYSPERHVWMIDTPEGATPLVASSDAALLEVSTKTMTQVESDDMIPQPPCQVGASPRSTLLELATKTEANPESDDR